jgi:O-antigen ligase
MVIKAVKPYIYIIIIALPLMSIINYFNIFRFNTSISDIMIIPFLIFLFINKKIKKLLKIPILMYFPILILIVMASMLLNTTVNENKIFLAINESIKIIVNGIYFIVGVSLCSSKYDFKHFYKAWFFSTILVVTIGITLQILYYGINYTLIINNATTPTRERFIGTLSDPNISATYLALSFFIICILYNLCKNRRMKSIYGIIGVLCILCLILTFSRGGIIAFFCTIFLYVFIKYKRNLIKIVFGILISLFALLLLINTDFTFFKGEVSNNFLNRLEMVERKEEQYIVRTNLFKLAYQIGKENPILGVGKGNYISAAENIINDKKSYEERLGLGQLPHNTIMGYFAETGVIGTMVFISLPLIVISRVIKRKTWLNTILLCIFLHIVLHSLTINIENYRGLWLILGSTYSYNKYNIDLKAEEQKFVSFKKDSLKKLIIIIIIVLFLLYLDVGRKIPNVFTIKNKLDISLNYKNQSLDQLVHFYIDNREDSNVKIIFVGYDENDKINYKKVFSYSYAYGFVNQDVKIPCSVTKIQVIIEKEKSNDGNTIIKEMYILDKVTDKKLNIIKKTLLLPRFIENTFSRIHFLYKDNTVEAQLVDYNYINADNDEVKDLTIKRTSLVKNNLKFNFNNITEDEILNIKTIVVENNINNIPNRYKKGIFIFEKDFKFEGNSSYDINTNFMISDYYEDFLVYILVTRDKKVDVYKMDTPKMTTNYKVNSKINTIGEEYIFNKRDTIIPSNGFYETEAITVDKGFYNLKVVMKGSAFEGVYPYLRVLDNSMTVLKRDFYITGDYYTYKIKGIKIIEDDKTINFLINFMNDSYRNLDGIVEDRNVYIKEIRLEKIDVLGSYYND